MTAAFRPVDFVRPAQRRHITDDVLVGAPAAAVAAAIAWRAVGPLAAVAVAVVALAVVVAVAVQRAQRLDRGWLIGRLDAARPDLDDSADLLFADDGGLTPLARLQRSRIERRIAAAMPDLRPSWSARRIGLTWLLALVAIAAIVLIPDRRSSTILAPSSEDVPVIPGVPRLVGQRLRIIPPAYTGLPPRDAATLDIAAPQGSRLDWTLTFAPEPPAADLVLADGSRTALTRNGAVWTARRTLDRSLLYRVVPRAAGAAVPRLHRLDAVVDAPPQVKVVAPDRSLSLVTPGQHSWPLVFAATDDYGVAASAQLHLTIAEGDGENVKFREQVVTVHGSGSATAKRFAVAVDLPALKFVAGSDLVAQLVVTDNRTPGPQTARSSSLILRWPASEGEAMGMEGVVTRALPAYFRSERQIIIDAEALLATRPRPAPPRFLAKSDIIGADQRLLRLRYGQFLGEEQEGKTPPPTADAAAPTADAPTTPNPPTAEGDGKVTPPRFGSEADTLADYGHVHDESEAATLLDPGTRKSLKGALDAMWQAELHLRQGDPAAALPFAHTALGLIKQVQQATRLFVAKVGPELPAIDETRRLTGKRDGLAHRDLPPVAATAADPAPAVIWRALAATGSVDPTQLAALEAWLRTDPAGVDDRLAFAAAIDAVRREPGCSDCREALRGLLWRAQVRPAAAAAPRAAATAEGRRYLDALRITP
ncbi:DUF4175 domain-containing protein [Polymorphobacter megasporae]|uniref:DUF4175 domain-containing protein n=1 Tax=Glacieibacterium megasporae TaxID=2835787 RepID=UPI001C1E4A65|nr:DUF4175 domain-containing protein [Polymorphobacter megasporae]UAJ11203.1 DUF4175 domain-containing protein [Polymorphobacter megasporae]